MVMRVCFFIHQSNIQLESGVIMVFMSFWKSVKSYIFASKENHF